jgi:HEAT repeat protein
MFTRAPASRFATAIVLALYLTATSGAGALDDLRDALKSPVDNLSDRDAELRVRVACLRTLGEQSQALLLPEWRDEEIDVQVAIVDRGVWRSLEARFEEGIRELLRGDDVARKIGAVALLGETGEQAVALSRRTDLLRGFAPDLVRFMKQADPRLVEASARALGRIHPDPDVALPALKQLLECDDAGQRLAAAEGLLALMNGPATLARKGRNTNHAEALRAQAGVVGSLVVPVAARGLVDEQAEVRQVCVETLHQAAAMANTLVGERRQPTDAEEWLFYRRDVSMERGALGSVVFTLEAHGPALGRLLSDASAEVRESSRRALEDIAQARQRLVAREETIVKDQKALASPAGRKSGNSMPVADMVAGLRDRDVNIRLRTLDILEALGPTAAPAGPALVKALNDPNRFVRWAAARALGKVGAVESETAIPALIGMLSDDDVDLRAAAASTLAGYGPAARTAVPVLLAALASEDTSLRVAALRALERIGLESSPALPVIRDALEARDASVRQGAARLLGKLGPSAREALGSLRSHLKDSSPEVRAAAQEALARIGQ